MRGRSERSELEAATEAFVRGFCQTRSATHPYLFTRIDGIWRTHDAPRKNPIDYRNEEWISCTAPPAEMHRTALEHSRPRYFICSILADGADDRPLRAEFKQLGYRLTTTEPVMIHRLKRIPKFDSPMQIVRVRTRELADRFGKAWKRRPMSDELLAVDSPVRWYIAISAENQIVGGVASVNAGETTTWVSTMYVAPPFRRRGIGKALLAKLLRDDRSRDAQLTVLTASHTGALLYPRVGFEPIGMLYAFKPRAR